MKHLQITYNYYKNIYDNFLTDYKKSFLDIPVYNKDCKYYAVFFNGEIIGCYIIEFDMFFKGFFTLKKNISHKILNYITSKYNYLQLNCIGIYLKELYLLHGFKVVASDKFDYKKANKYYKEFFAILGCNNVYFMEYKKEK